LSKQKIIEIMIDTYNDWNPNNPINQTETEPLTELEEQQEWNMELCAKVHIMKLHLVKLKQLEESFRTFGFLTFDEQTEKNNILNKY